MNDPQIWALALDNNQRRIVKKTAKKLGRKEVISIENDEKIGELCCWLLQKFHSRKTLVHILKRYGYASLHQALWNNFYLSNDDLQRLFPLDLFKTDAAERIYLNPDAFSARIREVMPKDDVLRSLVILGTAFAILQPDEAPAILKVFLEYEPNLLNQVLLQSDENDGSTDTSTLIERTSKEPLSEGDRNDNLFTLASVTQNVDRALSLTRTWVQGGLRISEDYLNTYAAFISHAENVWLLAKDLDFSQKYPMEDQAMHLVKYARDVHEAAAHLDAWLDEWSDPLKTSISSSPETLRNPLGRLFDAFRSPRSRALEIKVVSENLRNSLADLTEMHSRAIATHQGLQQKVKTLLIDLGRIDPITNEASVADDLIKIESSNGHLLKRKIRLEEEIGILINSHKATSIARLEQIDPTSRIQDANKIAQFERIREEIADIQTFTNIVAMEGRIQFLDESWPRLVPKKPLMALAADALQANTASDCVIQLAKELADVGRHAEAVLLLELLQEVYEPEAIEVDLQSFLESLLLSWSHLPSQLQRIVHQSLDMQNSTQMESDEKRHLQCWLTRARGFSDMWVSHALSGKWISQINKRDLPEFAIRRRLAGAFIALHARNASEFYMNSFYRLGLSDFEFDDSAKNLRRLHRDVIDQRRFVISDGILENKMEASKQSLTEFFFKRENGDYVHQIAHGNAVAEVERQTIFPELKELVDSILHDLENGFKDSEHDILSRITQTANNSFRKHKISSTYSAFYKKKIYGQDGYLSDLNKRIQRFLLAKAEYAIKYGVAEPPIALASLNSELEAVAVVDPSFKELWKSIQDLFRKSMVEELSTSVLCPSGVGMLLDLFPESMLLAPELVEEFASQDELPPLTVNHINTIIEQLACPNIQLCADKIKNAGCFLHAQLIAVSEYADGDIYAVKDVERLYAIERVAFENQFRELSLRSDNHKDLERARKAASLGKWPFAKQLLNRIKRATDKFQEDARNNSKRDLQNYRERIQYCQKLLEERFADTSADALIGLCGTAAARISSLIRLSQTEQPESNAMTNASQLADAIEFSVQRKTTAFGEIEALLNVLPRTHNVNPMVPLTDGEEDSWGIDYPKSSWEVLKSQRRLNEDLRRQCARHWADLVRWFCRSSGMYHDLNESLTHVFLQGCHFARYKSTFYSPRSAWLDRYVHFYLLLKTDEWEDQWSRLSAEIEKDRNAINIVIVPDGVTDLRKRFKVGKPEDPFVIIGEEEAKQVSNAKVPGAPLRQLLHRGAARLTDIGLFCTDGAVHHRKNLFVGRESALDRLVTEKASAVWGGRRIGKTSLLHALKERLSTKRPPFRVGYVYADPLYGDPDLCLAKRIAESLGLSEPEKVADLGTLLTSLCEQQHVGVLVDEVDSYILSSRVLHGDSKFPLARVLRGVSSQNPNTFKVVYAGFKQLYFEVNKRQVLDTAYPFKNFVTPLREDFGDLDADMVEKLLQIAFEEMLGITLEPGVTRLVKEKTSGHPAFVQEFGRQLLQIVDRRRRSSNKLSITLADVEAVYTENPDGTSGHSSYIDYVYETLNWNLSSLGKAILLAISSDIVANNRPKDHSYRQDGILHGLREWSSPDTALPGPEDLELALEFLVMTNMLIRRLDGSMKSYSVSYWSYIDFMQKLGDYNKIKVIESLKDYNEKEMGKIL